MNRHRSGRSFYLVAAVICIVGLWSLYLWQQRLERSLTSKLAETKSETLLLESGSEGGSAASPRQAWREAEREATQSALSRVSQGWLEDQTPGRVANREDELSSAGTIDRLPENVLQSVVAAERASERLVVTQRADESPVAVQGEAAPGTVSGTDQVTGASASSEVGTASLLPPVAPPSSPPADADVASTDTNDSARDDSAFRLSSSRTSLSDSRGGEAIRSQVLEDASQAEAEEQLRQVESPWPVAEKLRQQLEEMRQTEGLAIYADELLRHLDRMGQLETLADPRAEEILDDLQEAAASNWANRFAPGTDQAVQVGQFRFDLQKRIDIWRGVRTASGVSAAGLVGADQPLHLLVTRTLETIDRAEADLATDTAGESWAAYVALDSLREALEQGDMEGETQELLRRSLRRLESVRLNQTQQAFVAEGVLGELQSDLQSLVSAEYEDNELLKLVEAYELSNHPAYERAIARGIESLRWSDQAAERELGERMEVNYRNANLRLTISETMLNRMLPQSPEMHEPVQDRVLGAWVTGTSETQNRLKIQLVPDNRRLHLGLEARGVVWSKTRAFKDGFVFHNRGLAKFQASKFFSLDRQGMRIGDATAQATSSQETTRIQSDYDLLPLIGNIARSMALQEKNEKDPLAQQLVEQKVAHTARQRLDQEIRERLGKASQLLQDEVVGPLQDMGLEPQPIDMRTTTEELVMRYRLAAPEQLAAFTPRPQSLPESLVSFQLHESVVNNFAGALGLGGREFDLPGLAAHLSNRLNRELLLDDNVTDEVRVSFPKTGWLRLRFDDDRVVICLSVDKLQLNQQSPWRSIVAEAVYLPSVEGNQLRLIRDPETAIRIQGRRLRMNDQFAIRGVMNKVFDAEQAIEVIPKRITEDERMASAEIGQVVIENGWLGVSIVSGPEPEMVEGPEAQVSQRPIRDFLDDHFPEGHLLDGHLIEGLR